VKLAAAGAVRAPGAGARSRVYRSGSACAAPTAQSAGSSSAANTRTPS